MEISAEAEKDLFEYKYLYTLDGIKYMVFRDWEKLFWRHRNLKINCRTCDETRTIG